MYRVSLNNYFKVKKQNGFDSKFEAGYAQELMLRKKAKDIKDYKCQVPIELIVNGYKICTYIIDFVIEHNDGTKEYLETKGYSMPVWRLKWKLFEALYSEKPNTKLTVVMQGKYKRPKLGRPKQYAPNN